MREVSSSSDANGEDDIRKGLLCAGSQTTSSESSVNEMGVVGIRRRWTRSPSANSTCVSLGKRTGNRPAYLKVERRLLTTHKRQVLMDILQIQVDAFAYAALDSLQQVLLYGFKHVV